MNKAQALADLDARVFAARATMQALCEVAGVAPSTVSRWRKNPDMIRPGTLAKLERALDTLEAN